MTEDDIGKEVVDAAVQIHKEVGSGLLETVYEVVLAHEMRGRGLTVDRQVPLPIKHKGLIFDEGFRIDLLVEDKVIIELKCVERLNNAHRKQLLTYLRLTGRKLGYLLNFGEVLMKMELPASSISSMKRINMPWRAWRLGERHVFPPQILPRCH